MPKLTPRTISLIQNFATIENAMLFPAGRIMRVIHQNEAIAARAELDFDVPEEFAIANLKEFLKALSLFAEPEIAFKSDHLVISEGATEKGRKKTIGTGNKHRFGYSDKDTFEYPTEDPVMTSVDVQFTMQPDDFTHILKASGTLGLDILEIEGVKGKLSISAKSSNRGSRHVFSRAMGETTRTFRCVLFRSNFLIMPGTYGIEISQDGMIHFKGDKLEYWLAVEHGSSFGK